MNDLRLGAWIALLLALGCLAGSVATSAHEVACSGECWDAFGTLILLVGAGLLLLAATALVKAARSPVPERILAAFCWASWSLLAMWWGPLRPAWSREIGWYAMRDPGYAFLVFVVPVICGLWGLGAGAWCLMTRAKPPADRPV